MSNLKFSIYLCNWEIEIMDFPAHAMKQSHYLSQHLPVLAEKAYIAHLLYCKLYFQLKYFSKISCQVQYLCILLYIVHTTFLNTQMLKLWRVFWNAYIRWSDQKASIHSAFSAVYLFFCWEGTVKVPQTPAKPLQEDGEQESCCISSFISHPQHCQ